MVRFKEPIPVPQMSEAEFAAARAADVPALGGRPFFGGEAWITTARSRRSSANVMPKSRDAQSEKPSRISIVASAGWVPGSYASPGSRGFLLAAQTIERTEAKLYAEVDECVAART
jgi:hypothetical protein